MSNSVYKYRVTDFIGMLNKFLNNEIKNTKELRAYFEETDEQFKKRTLTLFSHDFTVPRYNHEYYKLRSNFLHVMGNKKDIFNSVKDALLLIRELIMAFDGKKEVINDMQKQLQQRRRGIIVRLTSI
jgi:hypothetical protein